MAKSKLKQKSKKTTSMQKQKATTPCSTLQLKAISEKQTKVQILHAISEATGLPIKQIRDVFLIASHLAKCHLIKKGSGVCSDNYNSLIEMLSRLFVTLCPARTITFF